MTALPKLPPEILEEPYRAKPVVCKWVATVTLDISIEGVTCQDEYEERLRYAVSCMGTKDQRRAIDIDATVEDVVDCEPDM